MILNALISSPIIYCIFYAKYRSNDTAFNAGTLIPSFLLVLYLIVKIPVTLFMFNYTSLLSFCIDIFALVSANSLFTNLNSSQTAFINRHGGSVFGILLTLTAIYGLFYSYKSNGLPTLIDHTLLLIVFRHLFYCVYEKTDDVLCALTTSALLLIPYYILKHVVLNALYFIYNTLNFYTNQI